MASEIKYNLFFAFVGLLLSILILMLAPGP
jgi:hypothetical protein